MRNTNEGVKNTRLAWVGSHNEPDITRTSLPHSLPPSFLAQPRPLFTISRGFHTVSLAERLEQTGICHHHPVRRRKRFWFSPEHYCECSSSQGKLRLKERDYACACYHRYTKLRLCKDATIEITKYMMTHPCRFST